MQQLVSPALTGWAFLLRGHLCSFGVVVSGSLGEALL
jgi:hypothetical protein